MDTYVGLLFYVVPGYLILKVVGLLEDSAKEEKFDATAICLAFSAVDFIISWTALAWLGIVDYNNSITEALTSTKVMIMYFLATLVAVVPIAVLWVWIKPLFYWAINGIQRKRNCPEKWSDAFVFSKLVREARKEKQFVGIQIEKDDKVIAQGYLKDYWAGSSLKRDVALVDQEIFDLDIANNVLTHAWTYVDGDTGNIITGYTKPYPTEADIDENQNCCEGQ